MSVKCEYCGCDHSTGIEESRWVYEKLSIKDRSKIEEAAHIISQRFFWAVSKKGQRYWQEVYDELRRIADSGEP